LNPPSIWLSEYPEQEPPKEDRRMASVALSPLAAAALQSGITAAGSPAGSAIGSSSAVAGASETPFAGVLKSALQEMGRLEDDAAAKADGLLRGTGVDVHAAMIATERSDLAFEMALALRSKAVSAYEQLNGMQF
jgi:flagellar hook-basal body complex protein FliE